MKRTNNNNNNNGQKEIINTILEKKRWDFKSRKKKKLKALKNME